MEVKCYNKKCLNEWVYRGKSKGYITCSKCHYRIKLDKAIIYYSNSKTKEIPKSTHSLTTLTHSQKKDLEEKPVVEFVIDSQNEEEVKIKEFDNISDFNMEIQKQEYEKIPIKIKEIKSDFEIRTIPRDPIKLLEHQKSFL